MNISLNNTRRRLDKLYAPLHFGMHRSLARRHPGHIIDRLRTGHESLRVRSVDPDLERQGRFRAVADGRVPDPGQVPDDGLAGGREGELAEEKAEDDLCTADGRGSMMDGGVRAYWLLLLTHLELRELEDRKSTRLNSSHSGESRMPSSA